MLVAVRCPWEGHADAFVESAGKQWPNSQAPDGRPLIFYNLMFPENTEYPPQ